MQLWNTERDLYLKLLHRTFCVNTEMYNRRKPAVTVSWHGNCLAAWPGYVALSTGECRVPAGCWGCSCPVFLLCPLHGWTSGALSHSAVGQAKDAASSSSFPRTPQVFCSCPTSSCSYRHCSYFNFARTPMILRGISKPLYSSDSLCLSSQACTASTQVALVLGPYLLLHMVLCSLPH